MSEMEDRPSRLKGTSGFLDTDQNIYDQPPFNQIVESACGAFHVDKPFVRQILSLYSRKWRRQPESLQNQTESEKDIANRMAKVDLGEDISRILGSIKLPANKRRLVFEILTRTVSGLSGHKYWYEYIEERTRKGEIYSSDGEAKRVEENLVPKFFVWESRRNPKYSEEAVFKGIREVFPNVFPSKRAEDDHLEELRAEKARSS